MPHGLQARADAFQNLVLGRHHAAAEARHDDRVEPCEPLQPGQHPGMNTVARKPAECGNEWEMRDKWDRGVLAQHPNAAQSNRHRVDEERIGAFRDRQIVEFRKPVHLIGDIGQIDLRNASLTLRPEARFAQRRSALAERAPVGVGQHLIVLGDVEAAKPALITKLRERLRGKPDVRLDDAEKDGAAEGLQALAQTGDAEPRPLEFSEVGVRESGCPAAGSGECRARRKRLRRRQRKADWECAARNCHAGGRWWRAPRAPDPGPRTRRGC